MDIVSHTGTEIQVGHLNDGYEVGTGMSLRHKEQKKKRKNRMNNAQHNTSKMSRSLLQTSGNQNIN
jgi:hypothetical protein